MEPKLLLGSVEREQEVTWPLPLMDLSLTFPSLRAQEIKQASTGQITNDTWCTWCSTWSIKRHRRGDLLPYFFPCSPAYASELCFLRDLRWSTIVLPVCHGQVCRPTVHGSCTVHSPCNSTQLAQHSNWPTVCSRRHDPDVTHFSCISIFTACRWGTAHTLASGWVEDGIGLPLPWLNLAPSLTYSCVWHGRFTSALSAPVSSSLKWCQLIKMSENMQSNQNNWNRTEHRVTTMY